MLELIHFCNFLLIMQLLPPTKFCKKKFIPNNRNHENFVMVNNLIMPESARSDLIELIAKVMLSLIHFLTK